MTFRIAFFPVLFALLFIACTNSDDFLYDESDSTPISIAASLSLEHDTTTKQGKTASIYPYDTVAFMAEITPSRSIRMRESYWTLDGETWAYEFSFRSCIPKPGRHTVAFILVDNFGDTLSDTLQLWVGNPPVLDENLIIPLPNTQRIPPEKGISFAWNAYDPDFIYKLHYHFTLLATDKETILDTILDDAHLVYRLPLNPLESYSWQVTAYNEIGMQSAKTINGSFYTEGVDNEAGIIGSIKTSGFGSKKTAKMMDISVSVIDSNGEAIAIDTISGASNSMISFQKKPLPPGDYRVVAKALNFSDFQPDTAVIQLRPAEVYNIPTLYLNDVFPPTIVSIPAQDTLSLADTLYFIVKDNGDSLNLDDINISFDGKAITDGVTLKNDTLAVPLAGASKSTIFRILTITGVDLSSNTGKKAFYITPTEEWFECNSDTMLYKNEILELFIKDTNPYGFEPDSFFYDIYTNDQPSAFHADSSYHSFKVTFSAFPLSSNIVRSGIRYKNGITKWKQWTVLRIFVERRANE